MCKHKHDIITVQNLFLKQKDLLIDSHIPHNAVTDLGNILNNQAPLGFMFNKLCLYIILGHPVHSMSKPTKLLDQIFLPSM